MRWQYDRDRVGVEACGDCENETVEDNVIVAWQENAVVRIWRACAVGEIKDLITIHIRADHLCGDV